MLEQALREVVDGGRRYASGLCKGELQFRRLLEKLPAGAYTCDPEGLISYFNLHAVQLWGRAPKLNDPVDRFCGSFKLYSTDGSPISHDRCWMAMALLENKEYNGKEIVIERPNSTRITTLAHANPIRDESGRLLGAVNVLVDISERKRAERYLTAQLRLTQVLAQADSFGNAAPCILQTMGESLGWDVADLWVVDESAAVLRCVAVWHPAAVRIPEFEAASRQRTFAPGVDLPGRIWASRRPVWIADLVNDPDSPRAPIAAREGLRGGFGYPILLGGQVLGVIECFSRETRERDDELLEIMANIGSRVGQFLERKRAEERLRRSEQELREANRAKDEFLATLAHELRNPLAPISNAVKVLRLKGSAEPELQWARDVIDRQTRRMARLIEDLLDVSRITRNRLNLRKERVELARVVQEAVETSRPLIEERGHSLTVTLPSEPMYLDADLTRLAQVFSNLFNNAAKYTEPGGRIRFTAERQNGSAVVTVRDSGIGIAAEMLPHVFEMFIQGDRSLEQSQGGLGIGLTLVKRLVELHGGSVSARSDGPAKGSEFTVRLPIADEPPAAPDRGRPQEKAATAVALRILVADDNWDSAASLGKLLQVLGHEVRTVHDGLRAVESAAEFGPEVVLLDIGMPKLNGYDAAKRIREQPWGKEMFLIAVTGWGQEEDRQCSRAAGFDHHLVKPVDPAALLKLLVSSRNRLATGCV